MEDIASGITLRDGIYFPDRNREKLELSYPDGGLSLLYEVEDKSYWFSHRNKCITYLAKKYSEDGLFVDVGGGNGAVSKSLQDNGFAPILVEPGESGCQNALDRGVREIYCGLIEEICFFPEVNVEAIGIFDVLEHIEDDLGFLRSLHSIISSEGYLYITVPAFNLLWSKDDVAAGHFRRYTRKSISEALQSSGFHVVENRYFFSLLFFPILLLKSIPSKLRLYRRSDGKTKGEHTPNGAISRFFDWRLGREFDRFKAGKGRLYGSSLLVVAKKF